MNSSDLDTRITTLASDIKRGHGFFVQPSEHFASCWAEVKFLGAAFKAVRYPARAEKQNAWDRFQEAVQTLKSAQDQHFREHRARFQQREEQSADIMREIIGQGEDALPPDLISGIFIAMVGLPFHMVEDAGRAMLGFDQLDHAKEDLKCRSEKLRQAFALLKTESKKLLHEHRDQAWHRLREIQDRLDAEWTHYKQARQQQWEAGQRLREARDARQAAWRENQRAYVERLRSALGKQEAYLEKKRAEMRGLEDKRDNAWSDGFRDKVDGWIEECQAKIDEVEASIRELEDKIAEAESRLGQ